MPRLPIIVVLMVAASMAQQSLREVLRSSTDRQALERAACTLARSQDPRDLELLGHLLRDRGFLARLDDLGNLKTAHLSQVMAALAEHPTQPVVELCLTLAEDPVFVAEGDRKSFVLELLAKVKPMSEPTTAVFARSNAEGYFASNARLLSGNGSPRALALFESMMLDSSVPAESRVQCLHVGIVPHRMEPPMLAAAENILLRAKERAVVNGVVESVFDFQLRWFGIESKISRPPEWRAAPAESKRLAVRLADTALARSDLSPGLRKTVTRTRDALRNK